jgi:hypothetical protein
LSEDQPAPPPVDSAHDPKLQSELRLFHRVLMSYTDFYQAKRISDQLLGSQVYPGEPNKNRTFYEALNCAAIVAYCRPFSGNEGSDTTLAALPQRFLKVLTEEERGLHDVVMADRNTVLAHSDSEAWAMEPTVFRLGNGKEILAPMHNPVHAPLTREAMTIFNDMCAKLMEEVFKERQRLEPIVWKFLRVVDVTQEELDLHSKPT